MTATVLFILVTWISFTASTTPIGVVLDSYTAKIVLILFYIVQSLVKGGTAKLRPVSVQTPFSMDGVRHMTP